MIDDRLYSAILRSLEQTHCARMSFHMSDWLFIARFLNIHRNGVLRALTWLVPHATAAVSAQVLCTPYNHAPSQATQERKLMKCFSELRSCVKVEVVYLHGGLNVHMSSAERGQYGSG